MKRKVEHTDISAARSIALPPEEEAKLKAAREKKNNLKKQAEVEAYNATLEVLDPIFASKTFVGTEIKVRLKKEDYIIKNSGSDMKDGIKKDNLIALETPTGEAKMIDNPLPYMFEGVIVAVPKTVRDLYFKEFGVDLVPGTYVELREFNLQAQRYYLDKANVDTKLSLEDVLSGKAVFPKHKGYFSVGSYDIESIA